MIMKCDLRLRSGEFSYQLLGKTDQDGLWRLDVHSEGAVALFHLIRQVAGLRHLAHLLPSRRLRVHLWLGRRQVGRLVLPP